MKWTYLLFLLFSSWMYQRIVFYPPVINYRAPAAVEAESCLDLMQGFYPNQTKEFLKKRIEASKNFHSFYRSFVPLFYDVVAKSKEVAKIFSPLKKYKAGIGGDVHVENFGFVLTASGNARLALNDVDDVTEGPVYLDVIRHYISGKIVSDDVHWNSYLNAYKAGLKGEDHVFSDYVKRNNQNASLEMKKILDEYVSFEVPIKFIKYKKPMYSIEEDMKKEIFFSLKKIFPKIKIYDQYLRVKEDGGSAGLKRFQVLAQLSRGDEPVWLDLKEMVPSSFDRVFQASELNHSVRMLLIKDGIYEQDISSHISMTKIAGQDFSIRYMNQFGLGVKIEEVSNLEIADVVMDEAFALGQMHARTLTRAEKDVEQYSKTWEDIPADDVKKSAKKIREELEKRYSSKI